MTTNAFITAALGVGIAAGVSYFFYGQTVGKWYAGNRKNSRHSAIKYWCGVVSSAAIFQGFSTLFVATFNHLLNEGLLNVDTFAKSAVSVIIFPSILFLLAFVTTKFVPEKSSVSGEISSQGDQIAINPTTQSKPIHKGVLIGVWGLIALLAAWLFIPSFGINQSEKTFEISSCNQCNKDGCRPSISTTGFKVQPPQVHIFYISDGVQRINTYPSDDNTQCTILKERNFAFECNTSKQVGELVSMQGTIIFDGNKTFQHSNNTTFGTETIRSKSTCDVK